MSHETLIQDLRQKSNDRIKQIRHEVETKAEELRSLKKEEFQRREAEVLGQLKNEAEKVASPILHDAQRTALTIEDEALQRLSERLYALATGMLDQVRQQDYQSVFAELVRELPAVTWEKVQVNPLDKEIARHHFPGSEVEAELSIIGGFIASTDGGGYQVVNTLKRRLEKGWPAILPLLLREIGEEQDASPAA